MALSCNFAGLLNKKSSCGISSDYLQNTECITLKECTKDVSGHLSWLKLPSEDHIDSEIKLILARAGVFSVQQSHLNLTICPRHRAEYGIRWRSCKLYCTVPEDLALHKYSKARGSDRVNSKHADLVLRKTKKLIAVGSPICRRCNQYITSLMNDEEEQPIDECPTVTVEPQGKFSNEELQESTDSDVSEDFIEQFSLLTVKEHDETFLSPETSSLASSSDVKPAKKTQDPRDKLNEFLCSRNISPVEKAWNEWNDVSEKTRKRYTEKAIEVVSSVLKTLHPNDSSSLWLALVASPNMNKALGIDDVPQSTKNYLQALAEVYTNAQKWDTRRQILSIFSGVADFKTISKYLPGITQYRYTLANLHAKQYGVGAPVPSQTTTRIRIDLKQLDHFLCFVTSPHIIQDLPFGQRRLKLSSGEVIEVPNVIRSLIPQRIVSQYLQYCQETGFKSFSERTMLRVLSECSASVRSTLQGLDYFAAEGAEAFDDLITLVHHVSELGPGKEWGSQVVESLKTAKLYLKGDFKTHLSKSSSVPDHCIIYSLSDPTDKDFKQKCTDHEHNELCSQCEGLKSVLSVITSELEKVTFASVEDRDEAVFLLNSSKLAIQSWKRHLLRSSHQDKARLDILQSLDDKSILLVNDWAMKFLPQKYRESQTDWFGKRGISWHISVVYRRVAGVLQWQGFIHVVQSCSQDSIAIVPIVQHILKTIKQEHSEIKIAFLRQDNAGCYHAAYNLLSCPEISASTGIKIQRVDFSDPQGGKGAADRLAATCKSHVRIHINEGNDVATATQLKEALLSNGGIQGVRVAALESIPTSKVEYTQKIPGITKLNNFKFGSKSVRTWRAYDVGKGKVIRLEKQSTENRHSWLQSSFSSSDFKPFKDDKTKASVTTCPTKEPLGNVTEPPADDHTQADVYCCPKDGCVRVFQRFSALEKHLSLERCSNSLEKQSLFDLAKVKYKAHLEEGVGVLPTLTFSSSSLKSSDVPAQEGWALKESRKKHHFSEKQRAYLVNKFNIGQTSGRKLNPEFVAKDMRRARGPDGLRLFTVSEFLKPQQISSYFSRLAAKARGQSIPEDIAEDMNAVEEEENFSNAREAVIEKLQLQHPITYDHYDLCSMVRNNRLKALKVEMLQIICEALELDVPVPSKKRKLPYLSLIENAVHSCGCH